MLAPFGFHRPDVWQSARLARCKLHPWVFLMIRVMKIAYYGLAVIGIPLGIALGRKAQTPSIQETEVEPVQKTKESALAQVSQPG